MPLVEGRTVASGAAAVPASLVVSVVASPGAVSVVAKPMPAVAAELRRGDVRLAA
ncbi:hypothetical protein [Streptomyces sp. HNM0574]|uniref:hypothetical protein n=1 Tax=Streptomyces sp. HNM0574 TaxID=2714954 RepID=UPI00146E09CA|nr:hypothetical protein [Streptomyces sp. HNM0574]NLU67148.1 hypothetical protein [Streptomyces sp. HNM0574]